MEHVSWYLVNENCSNLHTICAARLLNAAQQEFVWVTKQLMHKYVCEPAQPILGRVWPTSLITARIMDLPEKSLEKKLKLMY